MNFNFFKKKVKPIQKKQSIITNINQLLGALSQSSSVIDVSSLTFEKAIQYYESVGPLKKAINMIAKGFSQIQFNIEDQDGEFITEHPVLDLINNPNADFAGVELKKQIAIYYLLTGNSFLEATGNVTRPPLELFSKPSQFFSIESNKNDGFAQVYSFRGAGVGDQKFFRQEIKRRFRYYSFNQLNEIWHIRDFNARFSSGNLFGTMPISSIMIDLEQYQKSSNHNLSLLKNGARLSGILLKEGVLSESQYQRLKTQFDQMSGDANAGKSIIAESGDGKLDYKELSQNNKDMDFKNNKTDNRFEIYNNYEIPAPLVSPEHMTMQNYREARMALYDDSILPLTNLLQEEITRFLFHRYPDLKRKKLSFDEKTICTLRSRSNEDAKMKKDSGVLTIDEVRQLYAFDPIDGGEILYIPNSLVPLGEGSFANNNNQDNSTIKQAFDSVLKKAGFTEDEILAAKKRHFRES